MNDLTVVERHCKALMVAHGVGRLEFAFDRSKRRIGAMHARHTTGGQVIPFKITVSSHFARSMSMEEIGDTMLHEIAHALVPEAGHGPLWKATARRLGLANPQARKASGVDPAYVWKGICPSCNKVGHQTHRAPLRVYACGRSECRGVKFWNRVLLWHKNGEQVMVDAMPARYYAEWQNMYHRNRLAS